jgi:Lipopolysaccharide-assembly
VNRHRCLPAIIWSSVVVLLVTHAGCRYSFSGGSVPANLKTIAVPLVQDQSGFGDPILKDEFTQELVQKFTSDGSLTLADRTNADSILETTITSVRESATVVNPGEQVAQRRITVTAHVTFTDLKQRKKVWEKDFSQWGDFPSGATATQRNEGISEALRKLTEDILNETVAGW